MFDMFLSLLSYIAQNEREKIRERQRQGVILAKKAGRYRGDQLNILRTQQIRKND
ncbi:recombinase family protein [Enterococcus faecalis]|uniref:recombinase family protein n=1 Tax=Enterococcus faecalis TaxID=1351 RepID=UPI003D0F4C66